MKFNKYQLFADFSKIVDMYSECKTVFYKNACVKTCIDVLSECLDDALLFYEDEDSEFPTSYIIEMAMHYACNRGVFEVGTQAFYDYWNADLEGYYMPLSHKLKH